MRFHAIHTCPLWEDQYGYRSPGLAPPDPPVTTVGWVNVADIEIEDERHLFLLTLAATDT